MSPFSDGKVHANTTSVNLLIGQCFLGSFGILLRFEIDKGKASGSSCLSVQDDCDLFQRSKFGELLLQLALRGVQA